MRIAFYSDILYPELSGLADSIMMTGKTLQSRGHNILYVGSHYSQKEFALANRHCVVDGGVEKIEGLPVIRIPSFPYPNSPTGQSRFALPFGGSFSEVEHFKPDIIHVQTPFFSGLAGVSAARRLKVPLVGTNHTPIEEFSPKGFKEIMRHWDAWFYNHCDFVSTPFQELIDRMRQKGFRKPAHVVPNPAELSLFRAPSVAQKTTIKAQLGVGGPVLLYCGRLAAEKHIDVLIEAVAKLHGEFPTLTLIATGHGAAAQNLRALAKTRGVERNVIFTGFLPMEQLAAYYQAADIFGIMSTSDSQSLAMMQGYASGLPSLGARSHGLPDYIPPECGFLVEPGDVKTLSQRIQQLLLDIPLRERMSKAAISFSKQFAPQFIAEKWENIYEKQMRHRALPSVEDISSSFSASSKRLDMNFLKK